MRSATPCGFRETMRLDIRASAGSTLTISVWLPTVRAWKVREAACAAMNRRTMSGRAMELPLEHDSLLSLASRGAVSVLDASYKFCTEHENLADDTEQRDKGGEFGKRFH